MEVQAIFIEVQAIYYWSIGHLSSKYRPFVVEVKAIYSEVLYRPFLLKYRPFVIEVKAIYSEVLYRQFFIEVHAIYFEVHAIFLLKSGQLLLKYRPFIIEVQAIFKWGTGHLFWNACHILSKCRPPFIFWKQDFELWVGGDDHWPGHIPTFLGRILVHEPIVTNVRPWSKKVPKTQTPTKWDRA